MSKIGSLFSNAGLSSGSYIGLLASCEREMGNYSVFIPSHSYHAILMLFPIPAEL